MNAKKLKFVIVSPTPWSGGGIALHALCKYLSDMGYDARILYAGANTLECTKGPVVAHMHRLYYTGLRCAKKTAVRLLGDERLAGHPSFNGIANVSVRGTKTKHWPRVDENTVVVYPESAYGNLLGAKHVVRWLLHYYRYEDQLGLAYEPTDVFFSYREQYNTARLNPEGKLLHVIHFDLDLYRNYNSGPREGTCYIVRKGKDRPDLPASFSGPVIDNLSEREKVAVMNRSEFCVSFDVQSAYSNIAALCGCVSVIVPEPGKTRADYLKPSDKAHANGVAYGFSDEEIDFALSTRDAVKAQFERSNAESIDQVRAFARYCEEHFSVR